MANQSHGPEGMIFANKYRIVKLIGSGGMANVYLGIDMNTGLNVAIKILKPEYSSDEEFIRRFDSEAKAVASLNHSNIVKVFGVGHEGQFRYIVEEYVEGITVKDLINQNGHLDWRNVLKNMPIGAAAGTTFQATRYRKLTVIDSAPVPKGDIWEQKFHQTGKIVIYGTAHEFDNDCRIVWHYKPTHENIMDAPMFEETGDGRAETGDGRRESRDDEKE